jgi:hypothetical protein
MSKAEVLKWSEVPDEHDYPAAALYLSLVAIPALADVLSTWLAHAPTVHQHAKDILRAARLPLLAADDVEVARDLKKVRKGTALSPILLVRGDFVTGRLLQIADGYHRGSRATTSTKIPTFRAVLSICRRRRPALARPENRHR